MWGSSFERLFCFLGPIVPISPDSPLYIVAFLQPSHQTFVASCRFALIGLATFPHLIVYLDLAGKDRIIENSVLLGKGLPIIAAPSECRTVQEPTANSIKNTTAFSRMRTQEIPHLPLTEIRWDRYQLYPVIPRFIAIFVVEFDIHFPCVDDQVDIAGRPLGPVLHPGCRSRLSGSYFRYVGKLYTPSRLPGSWRYAAARHPRQK